MQNAARKCGISRTDSVEKLVLVTFIVYKGRKIV